MMNTYIISQSYFEIFDLRYLSSPNLLTGHQNNAYLPLSFPILFVYNQGTNYYYTLSSTDEMSIFVQRIFAPTYAFLYLQCLIYDCCLNSVNQMNQQRKTLLGDVYGRNPTWRTTCLKYEKNRNAGDRLVSFTPTNSATILGKIQPSCYHC